MHSENFLVNDGGDGKAVETVGESFPELDVVPPLALIVKSIYAIDGSALMIASQDEEVLRIFDLVCQK